MDLINKTKLKGGMQLFILKMFLMITNYQSPKIPPIAPCLQVRSIRRCLYC